MVRAKIRKGYNGASDGWEKDLFPINKDIATTRFRLLFGMYVEIQQALLDERRVRKTTRETIKLKKKILRQQIQAECSKYIFNRCNEIEQPTTADIHYTLDKLDKYLSNHDHLPFAVDEETSSEIINRINEISPVANPKECIKQFITCANTRSIVIASYKQENPITVGARYRSSREQFAYEIGKILKQYGIKLTFSYRRRSEGTEVKSGKGGVFYRVLSALFRGMGDEVLDLYPLIKFSIDRLS